MHKKLYFKENKPISYLSVAGNECQAYDVIISTKFFDTIQVL